MKKFAILLFLIPHLTILAQGAAGDKAKYEYRFLIDMPTAGILDKGFVGVVADILPNGVLISKIEVGVFDNISFGISYGGSNVIGAGTPDWYKLPGINVRARIISESVTVPSITLGFDSQGKGEYFDSAKRYAIKSPGFFAAVSKNFELLGYLCLHATANYSLEGEDGDNFVNLMGGVEKTLGPNISLILDYDFTLNDNTTKIFGEGNGYLNAGIRWALGDGFTIGFDLRDLLDNKKWNPSTADRALRIEYIKSIF
ncbi:MAG: hypothetical protein A2057_09935 [Ignavibacteria bacterium GWA2_35_9]|nr:MAG: hypothetical protein A2057_09935 [Ignavibacteria bacterium GWA2_35_9]OGU44970.1 MAG: hypothetical protein A2000_00165 [Ignavibacteria bacterium GWB2_36_8]OGU49507.1 MAG: hypothetical protein A2080_10935 [Ignavibacteria bacterium GWC2_36_12]OGU99626.1 MAG: hypothetical protein A2330_09615 [Ignavibacteria bacterium RIFOXYB2_FULL_36_7]